MKLKSIFQKKIDREIKGVIKAGYNDEATVKQELEEFVVTDELKVHIDKFFQEYRLGLNGATDNNAVWISGFFGSGKSHFLKILSYILKNENVCGKTVLSYFKGKGLKKSTLDNMKKAEAVSTDVILFNIASKVEQSEEQESLVNVFNRAFNEMRGLCGSKPWIAAMEEQLISEGIYDLFKNSFKEITGKEWAGARENFYFEKDFIIKALVKSASISEDSARVWCEKGEGDFTLNVEKFAEKVSEYCTGKGLSHHVVFLIDEIGQYMGKDTKLMLNLQTIVEELAVKCQGKCWVIVTAQEELSSFVGKDSKDFSKILGRFNTKIALSSANADEVIKKRMLKKNKKSEGYLKSYFEENETKIKNLFLFPKESGLKGYKGVNDFIETYPFVTYEFKMLQLILNGIRDKGAAGKDISRGERSLLEFYQNTAITTMNKEVGNIIPLYAFYSQVESYLKASIKEVILEAEKNEEIDDFASKVLKTLFLLKYVTLLEADIENISTLLISSFNDSKKVIKDRTNAALEVLLKEGLVEKSGKEYVFLTKEEQLINKEIDEISIEKEEISEKIGEIIFHEIYKDTKFNYSSQYKFTFNRYADNRIIGIKRSEIAIRIITAAFHIEGDEVSELKRLSQVEKEVIVDITPCLSCVETVEKLLKIDSYLRKKQGGKFYESFANSNLRKREERDAKMLEAEELLKDALRKSNIFVSGSQLQQGDKNGIDKIKEGLFSLINTEYFKLNYVKAFISDLQGLQSILNEQHEGDKTTISAGELALEEVRSFIEGSSLRGNEVNLNDVLARFTRMPYGWKEIDIQGIILQLIKSNEIKGVLNKNPGNNDINNVNYYIINKISINHLFFKPRVKISIKYIEALKNIGKELFNITIDTNDSEKAMEEFKELSRAELNEINHMLYELGNSNLYPGKKVLDLGVEIFKDSLAQQEEQRFYKEVYALQDDFEEYMDEIDEVKGFYFKRNNGKVNVLEKGDQRIIFDKAIEVINAFKDDEVFIEDKEVIEIMGQVQGIISHKKPYSLIQNLPDLLKAYDEKMDSIINTERNRIAAYFSECRDDVCKFMEHKDHILKKDIIEGYDKLIFKITAEPSLMKLAALEKLVERKTSIYKEQLSQ